MFGGAASSDAKHIERFDGLGAGHLHGSRCERLAGLTFTDFQREMMARTIAELEEEREAVSALL